MALNNKIYKNKINQSIRCLEKNDYCFLCRKKTIYFTPLFTLTYIAPKGTCDTYAYDFSYHSHSLEDSQLPWQVGLGRQLEVGLRQQREGLGRQREMGLLYGGDGDCHPNPSTPEGFFVWWQRFWSCRHSQPSPAPLKIWVRHTML